MFTKNSIQILLQFVIKRHHSFMKRAELYKRCYEVLEIPENSDQNTVRRAYLEKVKKVHPDSSHPESNVEKFQEVDECFKFLMEKFAKRRRNIEMDPDEDVQVHDIQHTAPQHRQFLSYGGYGVGSPYQREKQYQQIRAMKAQQNVLEHRLQKSAASEKDLVKKGGTFFKKHAIKTKYGYDRVVEDLIQEAMSKGDFNNLTGVGKPLKDHQQDNPYVDFTTHKMNKILIENGFTPEWITLSKEIRTDVESFKEILNDERSNLDLPKEQEKWNEILESHREKLKTINKKIDKYNLLVPILDKQMIHFKLERIAEKVEKQPNCPFRPSPTPKLESKAASDYNTGLFSLINSMMK